MLLFYTDWLETEHTRRNTRQGGKHTHFLFFARFGLCGFFAGDRIGRYFTPLPFLILFKFLVSFCVISAVFG